MLYLHIFTFNVVFFCNDICSNYIPVLPVSASDAFNFVDEMRQAAQNAQNINNFIYEPTSGLYYDQKSGYYYNAVIICSYTI